MFGDLFLGYHFSSGSSSQVRGGAEKHKIYAATFSSHLFMTDVSGLRACSSCTLLLHREIDKVWRSACSSLSYISLRKSISHLWFSVVVFFFQLSNMQLKSCFKQKLKLSVGFSRISVVPYLFDFLRLKVCLHWASMLTFACAFASNFNLMSMVMLTFTQGCVRFHEIWTFFMWMQRNCEFRHPRKWSLNRQLQC